jgi:outer membrane protein
MMKKGIVYFLSALCSLKIYQPPRSIMSFRHHSLSYVAACTLITLMIPFTVIAAESTSPAASSPSAAPSVAVIEQKQPASSIPATSFRVGYADIMKIAEQSEAGKVAKTHFEAKADKLKAQIETKQKLLEKRKAALEAKLPTYTPEQRTAKIMEYEKKVDELRKMLQKADKEMKPMQEELLKDIYGKIEAAARSYGEANGFSVILIKSELLYLGKNADVQDVTEALIQQINNK